MSERPTLVFTALYLAAGLGVLGDALLRATPWGLNVALWIVAFVFGAGWLARRHGVALGDGRWMALPAVLAALAFAWHDAATLQWLNGLAMVAALAFGVQGGRSGRFWAGQVTEHLGALVAGLGQLMVGVLHLLGSPRIRERSPHWWKFGGAAARALLIALPLVWIFAALLVDADPVFNALFGRALRAIPDQLFGHATLAIGCAWIAGGVLRGTFFQEPVVSSHQPRRLSGGMPEIGTVLALVDLLFLTFVVIQIRYLFGGAALMQVVPGLTYAEYARQGFFQLVTVAALVLLLLLVAHELLRRQSVPVQQLLFRALAGGQIVLLYVIMASAGQRMRLYQEAFGLTELRLYATAFMVWLAAVFTWFTVTVLRGRNGLFAGGAAVGGFVTLVLLHALNPDAYIVRTNLARLEASGVFDAPYAISLSLDALPELAEALPLLERSDRCLVAKDIAARWARLPSGDWRTWNWSRYRAVRLRDERHVILQDGPCPDRAFPQ